ncbi:MAG: ATP-binding protein [Bacteroidales bacterium]|nr:ATP-binding protein [Bacteroidales bacterium]
MYSKNFVSNIFEYTTLLIINPFKFGTIVEDDFFTDRVKELEEVLHKLDSENHLVLISPRRFGKSSLINKAITRLGRPSITIDMMKVLSVNDLSSKIVKSICSLFPIEKIKQLLSQFRIAPRLSYNPVSDSWDVSFLQHDEDKFIALEDAMSLIEKVSKKDKRMIVVFDEFQEVCDIDKTLPKQLRSIIQRQKGINYIFMGSQESMMTDIFEKKKSPFYHFGQRMNLKKIPYNDFYSYVANRLPSVPESEFCSKDDITQGILSFTSQHPYYTQQLASVVYEKMTYESKYDGVVEYAISSLILEHALDYERFWGTFNRTDRRVLTILAEGKKLVSDKTTAQSTLFSSLKKLVRLGYVNKTDRYELEDPFFGRWITEG